MAAKSRLELILELKNKLFNNKLMQTKRKFASTTDKMRGKIDQLKVKAVEGFRGIANEIPQVGRSIELLTNKYTLMGAAILASILLMSKATGKAAEFNHEFLAIQNLNLDKSKSELTDYKGLIADTAFQLGTDLNKTTAAFYDVQSATGLFGKDVDTVVKSVGRFSVATGADLNDSINATTKAMKAFNLSAEDVDSLLASNAKTVQTGIVNFAELARVQTEYAGAAAGAGQKVDAANKLFAAFTSIAKDANTGATMTKTAFEGLTQKNTIEGLKSIGVNMYDANGQMRDLSDVLKEVSTRFKGMTPQQIDELINKIGGPEGLRSLFVKLKTNSKDFFDTLEAFDASSFDLDKALQNAQGDVTTLGEIVRNRWNVVLATLGEYILPIVAKGLNILNSIVVKFYSILPAVVQWLNGFKIGIIAVGTAFAIAKVPYLLFSAVVITKNFLMGLSFKALGTAIKNVPLIGWILAAVAAFATLYQKSETFRAMIDGVLGVLKAFLPILKAIGAALADPLNPAKWQAVGKAWDNMDVSGAYNKAYDESLAKSQKERQDRENAENGLTPNGVDPLNPDAPTPDPTAGDITKVTGAGSQVKNITINIDALNKGGINTTNTILNKMSVEEIERWFNEAMMRVIRNAELSN